MKLTKVKYPITNPLVFAIVMKDAELRPTYVIFICTFDYYGIEEPIYFFEKYDVKKSLPYVDGTFTIILNTTCPKEKVPEPLRDFFGYVNSQEAEGDDPFIGQIHQMVEDLNGRKEIEQIMTLEEELDVRYSIGKKEGLEEGLAEGREKGLAEGKKDAAYDTARKMKADGLDAGIIAKYTGLSIEEIKKL